MQARNTPHQHQHQPRSPWAWATAGVVVGLLFTVVVFAPARWLAWGVQAASASRVQLHQAQGTVWQGSAQLVLGAGRASTAPTALPGRVHWRFYPSLQGLHLALGAPCCLPQDWVWTARPSSTGVRLGLSDLSAAQPSLWPSALLSGLGTPWNTLQLQGTLALSTQGLALDWSAGRLTLSGQAQLDATGISTSLSTLKPMGSYRVVLDGGPNPTLRVSTLQGSLQVSGAGQWVGGQLRFDGEASAAPDRAEALGNFLNLIGRRDGARAIIKVG
jgi:general secretion pathway protein N